MYYSYAHRYILMCTHVPRQSRGGDSLKGLLLLSLASRVHQREPKKERELAKSRAMIYKEDMGHQSGAGSCRCTENINDT